MGVVNNIIQKTPEKAIDHAMHSSPEGEGGASKFQLSFGSWDPDFLSLQSESNSRFNAMYQGSMVFDAAERVYHVPEPAKNSRVDSSFADVANTAH